MFTPALFTKAKRGKQLQGPQTDEQMNKLAYRFGGRRFSSRKEILSWATAWMNLEDIVLSEISWTQKDKYYMIPGCEESKVSNSWEQKVE